MDEIAIKITSKTSKEYIFPKGKWIVEDRDRTFDIYSFSECIESHYQLGAPTFKDKELEFSIFNNSIESIDYREDK